MRIIDELLIPDDQRDSPYGYAVNQVAHAGLGAGAAFLWLPLAGALVAGVAALQVVHTRRGGSVADGIEDVAVIAAGVAVVVLASKLALLALCAWLAIGIWRRS